MWIGLHLLEDGLESLGRRSPRALRLLKAQIIQARLNRHNNLTVEGMVGRLRRKRVALGKSSSLRLNLSDGRTKIGGSSVERGSTNRHCN